MDIKVKLVLKNSPFDKLHYVIIHKNKIIKYKGTINPLGYAGEEEYNELSYNDCFFLSELDKYDCEEIGVKATHRLDCQRLYNDSHLKPYVSLSLYQTIYINWFKVDTRSDIKDKT